MTCYINKKLVAVKFVNGYYLVNRRRYTPRKFWELMPDFVTRPEHINHHMFHY